MDHNEGPNVKNKGVASTDIAGLRPPAGVDDHILTPSPMLHKSGMRGTGMEILKLVHIPQ